MTNPVDPLAPDTSDEFLPCRDLSLAGLKRLIASAIAYRTAGIDAHIRGIEETVTILGEKLSAVDDIIVALNAATDEIAADLAALRDEIAASDPAVAAKFAPLLDRLTELGKDPENPVPTPEPEPEPTPEP